MPRSPSALLPFLFSGEGSPTKTDYRKKLVPSNLSNLEDLDEVRRVCPLVMVLGRLQSFAHVEGKAWSSWEGYSHLPTSVEFWKAHFDRKDL